MSRRLGGYNSGFVFSNNGAIDIQRGIYRDKDGAIYEVLMTAESAEDSELLVVYRELFGDYKFWVGPTENFSGVSDNPQFRLVKNL